MTTTPALACREFSGLSGTAPSTCAGAESTGSVSDSTGTSPCPRFRKLVAVDEKNDCPSDGARKPVLSEPRTTKRGSGCTRAVSLPSTVLAEVAVVLRASGDAEAQPPDDVSFDVHVPGAAVARLVDFVGRTEAGEDLRADRRTSAESIRHAAVTIRVRLAGVDLIVLAAILGAERDVQRSGQALDLQRRGSHPRCRPTG